MGGLKVNPFRVNKEEVCVSSCTFNNLPRLFDLKGKPKGQSRYKGSLAVEVGILPLFGGALGPSKKQVRGSEINWNTDHPDGFQFGWLLGIPPDQFAFFFVVCVFFFWGGGEVVARSSMSLSGCQQTLTNPHLPYLLATLATQKARVRTTSPAYVGQQMLEATSG